MPCRVYSHIGIEELLVRDQFNPFEFSQDVELGSMDGIDAEIFLGRQVQQIEGGGYGEIGANLCEDWGHALDAMMKPAEALEDSCTGGWRRRTGLEEAHADKVVEDVGKLHCVTAGGVVGQIGFFGDR